MIVRLDINLFYIVYYEKYFHQINNPQVQKIVALV